MDLDEHAVFGLESCPAADAVPPLFRRPNVIKPAKPLLCRHDRPARTHVPSPERRWPCWLLAIRSSGTRYCVWHMDLSTLPFVKPSTLQPFNPSTLQAFNTSTLLHPSLQHFKMSIFSKGKIVGLAVDIVAIHCCSGLSCSRRKALTLNVVFASPAHTTTAGTPMIPSAM